MMKPILRGIAVAAMAGLALIARAQDTNLNQYPTILTQPDDLCLAMGDTATFSVVATNADTYQWYKNNVTMDGETNSSVTIPNVSTNDVGYYSALVINSVGSVPTRSACLNVYVASLTTTTSTTTKTLKTRLSTTSTMTAGDLGGGGTITVFGAPVMSSGSSGGCPGAYIGYVSYTKALTNGWGWAPSSTNTTVFIATDNNRLDTKIQYFGKYGDAGCNQTSVTVPYPAPSSKYRFTIFFTSDVPTNAYPITLTGFDP